MQPVYFAVLMAGLLPPLSLMQTTTDEDSIREMIAHQAAAWNRGDGVAWAKDFSDDADFVNIRGDVFHGRAEIAQRHNAIFASFFKGSHVTVTVRRFTMLTADVALVETDHEVTGFTRLAPGIAATAEGVLKTRMKYVVCRRDGAWTFAAAQNTAIVPAPH